MLSPAEYERRYREGGCTLLTTVADGVAVTRDAIAQLRAARA